MNVRAIQSSIYGNLGTFKAVGPSLYKSDSGRVLILGEGNLHGKNEGTLYLDQHADQMEFRVPQHSLVVCDDFLQLEPCSIPFDLDLSPLNSSPEPDRITKIAAILIQQGFSPLVAVRAAGWGEDQMHMTGAGVFDSKYFVHPLGSVTGQDAFSAAISEVVESNYSIIACNHFRLSGLSIEEDIPLPALLIQDLAGAHWPHAPGQYFPLLAGIVNTGSPSRVKVNLVYGFGQTAANNSWIGYLYSMNRDGKYMSRTGQANGDFSRVGLETGEVMQAESRELRSQFWKHELNPRNVLGRRAQPIMKTRSEQAAKLALSFQAQLGCPVEMELATDQEDQSVFLQIRPVHPQLPPLCRPRVKKEDLILAVSGGVMGQTRGLTFKNVLIIQTGNAYDLSTLTSKIKSLAEQFPDTLVYISSRFSEFHQRGAQYALIPFFRTLLVNDYTSHRAGDSLSHFQNYGKDLDVSLVFVDEMHLEQTPGTKLLYNERITSELHTPHQFSIYQLPRPIGVSVNDEGKQYGMVYWA